MNHRQTITYLWTSGMFAKTYFASIIAFTIDFISHSFVVSDKIQF